MTMRARASETFNELSGRAPLQSRDRKYELSPLRGGAVRIALALALLNALPVQALAAPAPDAAHREQARTLAARGFAALQRRDYAAAEELFRRADELVHAPTLVLDHARALVGLGRLVEGHEGFAQVLREGVPANAPWQWKKAIEEAAAELAAVEPRLSWLTINVKGAAHARVEIDGKPVPEAVWGIRRATNPGPHVISARAERYFPAQESVTLKEGQSTAVQLNLEPDPNAVEAVAPPPATPEVIVVAAQPAPKAHDRTLPTVLLAAGGVGLATGVVTGFIALRARSDLRSSCSGSVCVPNDDEEYALYRQKRDRYRAFGTASGVGFAVGTAAALAGAALLVFSGKEDTAARESGALPIALEVGPGSLRLRGRF